MHAVVGSGNKTNFVYGSIISVYNILNSLYVIRPKLVLVFQYLRGIQDQRSLADTNFEKNSTSKQYGILISAITVIISINFGKSLDNNIVFLV